MIKTVTRSTRKGEPLIASVLHSKAAKTGIPLAGNFELTARCNFGCKMCYVHQNCSAEKELSAQEWIRIGEKARERGMLFLLLTGGEPMLRKDFKEIYLALRNMGLLISINTNGSLINDEILEMFKYNPPTRINVSLYGGCNETYQNLCGIPAFNKVSQNILKLKQAGLDVKINCSITPYNAQDVVKIHDFAREAGINISATSYMFPPTRINGKQYGNAPARFSAEEAAKYMVLVKEQKLTPEQLADISLRFPEEEDCTGDTGLPMRCRAGRSAFWVTWDGRMLPCGMFPTDGYSVYELGFEGAWQKIRIQTSNIIMPAECTGCSKKERCAACAAACLTESGDTRIKPEYICRMTHIQDQMIYEKYGRKDGGDKSNEDK